MDNMEFNICLRTISEVVTPQEISSILNIRPVITHNMGEPRKTPTGQLLDGVYKINYCVFEFENIENKELAEAIDHLANKLTPYASLFNKISDSGGRSEFFISWYSKYNSGEIFGWELLCKLVSLHIDIAIDIYGTGYED